MALCDFPYHHMSGLLQELHTAPIATQRSKHTHTHSHTPGMVLLMQTDLASNWHSIFYHGAIWGAFFLSLALFWGCSNVGKGNSRQWLDIVCILQLWHWNCHGNVESEVQKLKCFDGLNHAWQCLSTSPLKVGTRNRSCNVCILSCIESQNNCFPCTMEWDFD